MVDAHPELISFHNCKKIDDCEPEAILSLISVEEFFIFMGLGLLLVDNTISQMTRFIIKIKNQPEILEHP